VAFGIACQRTGRGLRRLWPCVIICGGLRDEIGRERGGALAARSGRLPDQAELADPEQSRGSRPSRPARTAMAGEPKL